MNDYVVCLGAPYAYQAFRAEFSLEEIYERYRGPIFHYLYRLCGSAEQAEDLAQEAFTKACAGLGLFSGRLFGVHMAVLYCPQHLHR